LKPVWSFGRKAPSHHQQRQHHSDRGQDGSELDSGHHTEKPAIALIELAAPQRHVEIISYRRKIAVDGRRRQRADLRFQVGHAVRHHPKRDEVFAYIAGFQISRVQARQQLVRTRGQHARLPRREEVHRLARNGCHFREHCQQALVDGA